MSWPLDCPADEHGYHEPTVIGTPYDAMTYYLCRKCGKRWERGMGCMFGKTPPEDQTIIGRLTRIERLLKEMENK